MELNELYYETGRKFFKGREYEKAIDAFSSLIEVEPDNIDAYSMRGLAYGHIFRYLDAIKDFDLVIFFDSQDFGAYNNRALSYYKLEEFDRAIEDYDTAIELKPDEALFYSNRGLCYFHKQQYKKAIDDYNTAIALDGEIEEAHGNRGEAYLALGEYKKALADFNRELEINPLDTHAFANRAMVLGMLGEEPGKNTTPVINVDRTKESADWLRSISDVNQDKKQPEKPASVKASITLEIRDSLGPRFGHGIVIYHQPGGGKFDSRNATVVAFVDGFKWRHGIPGQTVVKVLDPESEIFTSRGLDGAEVLSNVQSAILPCLLGKKLPVNAQEFGKNLYPWING